jgi:hypothetical protein
LLPSTVDTGDSAVSKVATNVRRSALCVRFQPNLNFLGDFVVKIHNIKFHENPSSGNQVVPYERTKAQENNMKLLIAYRNFLKALKIVVNNVIQIYDLYLSVQLRKTT